MPITNNESQLSLRIIGDNRIDAMVISRFTCFITMDILEDEIFAGFNVSNQILSVYVNNTINVDLLTDNNKMTEAEFFGKYGNPRNIPINRERMIRRFLMNHKKLDLYIPRKTEYYHMYFEGSDYVNGLATDVIRYIILNMSWKDYVHSSPYHSLPRVQNMISCARRRSLIQTTRLENIVPLEKYAMRLN